MQRLLEEHASTYSEDLKEIYNYVDEANVHFATQDELDQWTANVTEIYKEIDERATERGFALRDAINEYCGRS